MGSTSKGPLILNFLFVILLCMAFITMFYEKIETCKSCYKIDQSLNPLSLYSSKFPHQKKFVYLGKDYNMENLFSILNRLGYRNDYFSTQWDLYWGNYYIFNKVNFRLMNNMKSYQLVNQFKTTKPITAKYNLNRRINGNESFVMPSFYMDNDRTAFLEYIKLNPKAKFVMKSVNHRGIALIDNNYKFDEYNYFLQRFVDNPLLVAGHKFELGIYTIITSIDPIRAYIYYGDIALRFCPEPYHPFDPNKLDKYVVSGKYRPIWNMPEISDFYEEGYGMRSSLIGYFKSKGIDISTIFDQVVYIIRTTIINARLRNSQDSFPGKRNFFELLRFDFLVDDTLKVFLLECNFIPNLVHDSEAKNRLLFEQIIYNMFSLVGAAPRIKKNTLDLTFEEASMIGTDRHTSVYIDKCSELCITNCNDKFCTICHNCMNRDEKEILLKAYSEHVNKMECKRIMPPEMHVDYEIPDNLPEIDKWMYKWYLGKCLQDHTWCK